MSYIYDKLYEKLKSNAGYANRPVNIHNAGDAIGHFRLKRADMIHVLRELERDGKIRIVGNKIIVLR